MLKKILIVLVLAGVGFGLYSLGNFIISASRNSQKTTSSQQQVTETTNTAQAHEYADNVFNSNQYTPKNYRPPNFDPFSNTYRPTPDYKEILGPSQAADTPPNGSFRITSKKLGFGDLDKGSLLSGTVNTEFIFQPNALQDKETSNDRLQVRWDFDGDSLPDTFFSRIKTVRHTYDKTGTYTVTMEILDKGGNVASYSQNFKVVENTEPSSYFTFSPTEGTTATIFTFNTQKSSDSQFLKPYLEYRFDWNSDGKWDTTFEKKNIWKHAFKDIGVNHVTLETRDPEGLVDQATADITIMGNTPPNASFTYSVETLNTGKLRYNFDASSSNDDHTSLKNLKFRWDFNYTGENDIVFDTGFSSSPKMSGNYGIPGQKTVRLQVKDEDGTTADAFATIIVE